MSLLLQAVRTYDSLDSQGLVGTMPNGSRVPIAPVAHNTKKPDLIVSINGKGEFVSAKKAGKDEALMIIPVTEKSSGRTKALSSHPLHDKVQYLAATGDGAHDLWLELIGEWSESKHWDSRLNPILTYAREGRLLQDLDAAGIPYDTDSFVVWQVDGVPPFKPWEDRMTMALWEAFYRERKKDSPQGLCMVAGETGPIAEDNIKGIFSGAGNAKLVSWKDERWKGRFRSKDDALTIGFDASQKAHNVLKWAIANGFGIKGGEAFACWSPEGGVTNDMGNLNFSNVVTYKPEDWASELKRKIIGLRSRELKGGLCCATFRGDTDGRLGVVYYNEFTEDDIAGNLEEWSLHHTMPYPFNGNPIGEPSLYTVVDYAQGRITSGDFPQMDGPFCSTTVAQLMKAKVEGGCCPRDIMMNLAHRFTGSAGKKLIYRAILAWITCSMIRGYRYKTSKEDIGMSLNKEMKDRSYQFGRLLAVMEKVERDTFDADEKREPGAIRMMQMFAQRPAAAKKVLMEKLKTAYWPKLKPGTRTYYDKLIGEIEENLSRWEGPEYGRPLTEMYIPGYYLQKNELYKGVEKNDGENAEEEI